MNEHVLKEWHEAIGKLTGVKEEKDTITIEFTTVWSVKVPKASDDLIKKLKGMIGKKIGVLRTDIPGREILLREDIIVSEKREENDTCSKFIRLSQNNTI